MFERLSEQSRHVVVLAQEEAMNRGDDHIGTEHILLAVASENGAVAVGALRDLGVDLEQVRCTVIETRSATRLSHRRGGSAIPTWHFRPTGLRR